MNRKQLVSEIDEVVSLLELEDMKPSVTGYFPSIIEILSIMRVSLLNESPSAEICGRLFSGLVGNMGRDWYFEGSSLGRRIQNIGHEFVDVHSKMSKNRDDSE